MKQQVVVIHGGDTFTTYDEYFSFLKDFEIDFERYRTKRADWKRGLAEALGDDYEVIAPDMPNKANAKYAEWSVWFEKFIPYFDAKIILLGHSLGGIFLVKYLSENPFPKTIQGLFLVAACHDDYGTEYSLADFTLPQGLSLAEHQAQKIFLYHSRDDRVVPFSDFEKYKKDFPRAAARAFKDRGHFNQETFPEIVEDIRNVK